jgi:hypothetical protein
VTQAADDFTRSQLRLEGAARFANIPLQMASKWAAQIKQEFKTSTPVANDIAGVFTRMGARAGDMNAAAKSMRDFLNVGASMGLSASETIFRVDQAVRGLDEGTDVLFQKNPIQIYKEYAKSIGTTAMALTSAQQAQALMTEASKAAARDPGAYQRFLDTTLGKQAQFNAKLLETEARFGTALAPIRMFAYEVGTVAMNALTAFGTGMGLWLQSLKMTFVVALPSLVKIGVGNVILLLGQMVGAVSGLLGKLGIDLGAGLAAKLTSFGANLVGTGQMGTAQYGAWREKSLADIKAAFTGGGDTDMSPITFPDMPPGPPDTPSDSEQKKRLARLLRMFPGRTFADNPNKLGFSGFGGPMATRDDRIDVSGNLIPRSTGSSRGQGNEQFEDLLRASESVRTQFRQAGTQLGMTVVQGFAAALSAGLSGKNPFKAFGNVVLAGLGSLMSQMGSALITYGTTMLNLLPFLTNIFTSGPAAIVAGALLVGLGATLGGIATGSKGGGGGKGGSGGFGDKTTHITLTADGLGGRKAPNGREPFAGATLLSVDSPRGQRVVATSLKGAARRNIK